MHLPLELCDGRTLEVYDVDAGVIYRAHAEITAGGAVWMDLP